MHTWGPRLPNVVCGLGSRPTSNWSGSGKTSSSKFRETNHTTTLSPSRDLREDTESSSRSRLIFDRHFEGGTVRCTRLCRPSGDRRRRMVQDLGQSVIGLRPYSA